MRTIKLDPHTAESQITMLETPDLWPLYPMLPVMQGEREQVGLLICSPGFPSLAIFRINVLDPRINGLLRGEDLGVDMLDFASKAHMLVDGWVVDSGPNDELELFGCGHGHMCVFSDSFKDCQRCVGKGWVGHEILPVRCPECHGLKVVSV